MPPRIIALLFCAVSLHAHVTRIVIEHRESPAYGAKSFASLDMDISSSLQFGFKQA